ncbi:hypothetical protein A2304_03030 [Candidatus Uhrbacteria bacterium RIFOXYB2_FULL_57_15]|uniref:Major facilitator superfamily (MFS) profile domain-containing protein n=1 Tax=Candidatus Uhrbacteria bacterium RIFOXYB2_FULL_57_15 TaxID=1802422 RepID=A0A1F7W780_9BACT|nr:MAG: hypothetical protein A2304_03030 [Candidatus Uhrbacteria bacterium RIFOXYB2_FULL_57_15]
MRVEKTYYLFTILLALGMGMTVSSYGPFLREIGLSLGQIALVNAVFWLVLSVSEIPTGLVADGRGRAWSLRLGTLFEVAGAFTYFFASGVWSAMLAEVLFGIGMAFLSGAQQAWLVDALRAEKRGEQVRHAFATAGILSGVGMLVGGGLGALVSMWRPHFIWLPMVACGLAASWLAARHMEGWGNPETAMTEREAFRQAVRTLRSNSSLWWLTGTMLVFGLVIPFNNYWSVYFEEDAGRLGLAGVWTVIYLSVMAGSWLVRRVRFADHHEGTGALVALGTTAVGLLVLPAVGFPLSFAPLVLHELGRGALQPLSDSFVQRRVESGCRATFGSLLSLIAKAGNVSAPLAAWWFTRGMGNSQATIAGVWITAGAIMLAFVFLLWVFRPREAYPISS